MSRILNVYALMEGIEKYVVAGAVPGLTSVAWHDDESAFTDGNTIHLPRPNALWNDEQLLLWRYKAEHELGHEAAINADPHWKEVKQAKLKDPRYKDDGLLWWIANVVSDHVQEHNRIGEMVGRDEVLLHGRAVFLDENEKAVKEMGTISDEQAIACGIFAWDTGHRRAWNSHIKEREKLPAKVKAVADKVAGTGINPANLRNEQHVFDAAVEIRKLFPEVKNDNNFMGAKPIMGGRPGKSGKGKDKEDFDAAGKKRDKCPAFLPNGIHEEARRPASYSYAKREGSYKARKPSSLAEGKHKYGFNHGRSSSHMSAVRGLMSKTNLPAKVRGYLMAMKREKLTTGWRSGRLDTSRLPDVLRGRDDMFRRKEPVRLVDSAVYLLVDSSGSMSGTPFQSACASALMMAEALQGIGVSVEIAGFTEYGDDAVGGLIHDIWLPFGQRFVKENVLEKMGQMAGGLSNNVDGENILFAYNRLRVQKESRKILIVLSDGEPAGQGPVGATMGPGQFTKQVCDTIQKDKSVLLVGLGMSGYKPSRFYKNAYEVKAGQKLEPVLLNIVKDAVLR